MRLWQIPLPHSPRFHKVGQVIPTTLPGQVISTIVPYTSVRMVGWQQEHSPRSHTVGRVIPTTLLGQAISTTVPYYPLAHPGTRGVSNSTNLFSRRPKA